MKEYKFSLFVDTQCICMFLYLNISGFKSLLYNLSYVFERKFYLSPIKGIDSCIEGTLCSCINDISTHIMCLSTKYKMQFVLNNMYTLLNLIIYKDMADRMDNLKSTFFSVITSYPSIRQIIQTEKTDFY